MKRSASVPVSMSSQGLKLIPKHELRKIKKQVAKLRVQGHEIFTDDEIESAGWTLETTKTGGLHIEKEKQKESWNCGLACVQMVLGTLLDVPAP